ncbi:hypothetical protein GCM10011391_39410 [Pullulanibacillus camelliae]|uniref:DUF4183 domain-containing protein n=1 Tax=Pullulanibacillus camelliae TaxID=1707096 RepID=A0A8J2YNX5_9BACL|nr:DUF4183 domain-containing protein [Pullulanibacillus camelliae]GGE56626.1 hypothetical protein GCM10011391_39410 [Pullulanibacillus camelliae]
MPLQLMKLFISATTETTVTPENTRFFYVTSAQTDAGSTLTVDAASFFADDGSAVTELPELAADNSYFNVYVNGVLQMNGLSTYTPGATGVGSLAFDVPADGEPILSGSPVVLEVVNYAPESTITIDT